MRLERRPVRHHADFHLVILLRLQVQQVEPARVLEDDVPRPDAGEVHVELLEEGHLPELVVLEVAGPDVGALVLVAVGEEIERLPVPHRVGIGGGRVGQVAGGQLLQVEQPDVRVHAAAVTFPGAEIHADRHVGQRLAVRRNRPELAIRHRQLLRQPPLGRHAVKLVEPVLRAGHRGRVEDGLAVGIPSQHPVRRPVMGEPPGQAARRRHHVNVLIAVVIAGEGQQRAVRREARERLFALGRADPHRHAAALFRQPDVARIDEGDLGRRHRRLPHHPRINARGDHRLSLRRGREQPSGAAKRRWAARARERRLSRWYSPH